MAPEMFGPYRLDAVLGHGGMGEVFRAYDTDHGREVALKRLPAHLRDDEQYRRRFHREATIAARLSEPHVVPVHRFGEIDGHLFVDMRLVDGRDLGVNLAEYGPARPDSAVDIVSQVAAALDAAHAAGLVHRDVKPSNVLLTRHGFAYLCDFGIALAVDPVATRLTGSGSTVGTLTYMAPERFSEGPVDQRVDVYSLACLSVEVMTGRPPFPVGNPAQMMYAHLYETPPQLSLLGLPPALDAVVTTGMAKRAADRYASAGQFAEAARAAVRDVPARVTAVPPRLQVAVGGQEATAAAPAPTRVDVGGASTAPATAPAAPHDGPARLPGLVRVADVLATLCTTALLVGQLCLGTLGDVVLGACATGAVGLVRGLATRSGQQGAVSGLVLGNGVALVLSLWLVPGVFIGVRGVVATALMAVAISILLIATMLKLAGAGPAAAIAGAAADTCAIFAVLEYFVPFIPGFRVGLFALLVVAAAAVAMAVVRWRAGAGSVVPILLAATLPVVGPFSAIAALSVLSTQVGTVLWALGGLASVLVGMTAVALLVVAAIRRALR